MSDSRQTQSSLIWRTGQLGRWVREQSRSNLRTWFAGLFLGAIFFTFLYLVQTASPSLAGTDGYYHIKFAYVMRTEGLKPEFPWLQLTVLNAREFYDHHFLFHIALIPFTFGDLLQGAKLASVVFSTLAFLGIWLLFHRQGILYASLWSLGLLAISEAFIYRMSLVRAMSLSLLVLVVGLHWMFTHKYKYLSFLGFFYVWLYNAFPLLIAIVVLYTLALAIIERRLELRPLFYASLGVGLGILINPYFPHNIIFVYRHLLPKLIETTAVRVGNEWYPYDTTQLMQNSPLALVAFISGILALGLNERRMDARTATTFLVSILFGVMLFRARHFIEYFAPFALIFAAFSWESLIHSSPRLPAAGVQLAKHRWAWFRNWLPLFLILLFLLPGLWITFQDARNSVKGSTSFERYAQAAAWLENNTPPGERVFQTDWDDFTRLFFYNTHNTYLIGLDPTYMQLYDAELYDLWVEITKGDVERLSDYIYPRFGARYILTDHRHTDFIQLAGQDTGLVEVYRDKDAIIYKVLE